MSGKKRVVAVAFLVAGLLGLSLAGLGCSSGDGPAAAVGEQVGGAVGREATDDNPVGEAVGAAAGNAAGDKADKGKK